MLPDLLVVFVVVFVLFCFVLLFFVFLWCAWIFLLLLALRLIQVYTWYASIWATSWTSTVNLPDLILHLIFCAFPLSQSRLLIGSRGRVLTWTRGLWGDLPWKNPPGLPLPTPCILLVQVLLMSNWWDQQGRRMFCCKKGLSPTHPGMCVFWKVSLSLVYLSSVGLHMDCCKFRDAKVLYVLFGAHN